MKGVKDVLYLISEYVSEYPYRNLQSLEKFKSCPKYLHQMSLDEINQVVKHWIPLTERTAYKQRKQILNYFKWLQSKGEKVNSSIVDKIEIPILEKHFLIYSTKELKYYYNELFDYLKDFAEKNEIQFSKSIYYMCYASGILSFYGLTEEEIIALDLLDIQNDGVKGYDLPLTKDDLEILMTYRNTVKLGNRKPLLGNKFIRSTHSKTTIDASYLSRPLWRINFDQEHLYLKKLLSVNNLYWLGIYSRIFKHEADSIFKLEVGKKSPQWFIDMIGSDNAATLSFRKKEYIEYRNELLSAYEEKKYEDIDTNNDLDNINIEIHKEIEINTDTQELYSALEKAINEQPSESSKSILKIFESLTNKMQSMENELNTLKKSKQ